MVVAIVVCVYHCSDNVDCLWHIYILCIDFEEKLHPICILQYTYPKNPDIKEPACFNRTNLFIRKVCSL